MAEKSILSSPATIPPLLMIYPQFYVLDSFQLRVRNLICFSIISQYCHFFSFVCIFDNLLHIHFPLLLSFYLFISSGIALLYSYDLNTLVDFFEGILDPKEWKNFFSNQIVSNLLTKYYKNINCLNDEGIKNSSCSHSFFAFVEATSSTIGRRRLPYFTFIFTLFVAHSVFRYLILEINLLNYLFIIVYIRNNSVEICSPQ